MKKLVARDFEDMLQVRSLPAHAGQQTHHCGLVLSHKHPTSSSRCLPPSCLTLSHHIAHLSPCIAVSLSCCLTWGCPVMAMPPMSPHCHLISPHPVTTPCPARLPLHH